MQHVGLLPLLWLVHNPEPGLPSYDRAVYLARRKGKQRAKYIGSIVCNITSKPTPDRHEGRH